MVENVIALSTSYANDKKENDVGTVSENEAREALRLHKGHIWASVTECVETRQRKFLELKARGKFSSKDITDALTSSQGDVELAYSKLSKSTSKPFLMRIWGAGEGAQNKDGALPKPSEAVRSQIETYQKNYMDADDVQSDELWDEEEEDVEWDDDYDEQEDEDETEDINLQTCRDDICLTSDITTPDSDRSDYCDAFGTNTLERNMASPGSDTFDVTPDTKQTKKSNGLLSKLAALRKEGKDSKKSSSKFYDEEIEPTSDTHDDVEEEDNQKSYNPLNVLKNTFSAIRDTVSGSSKSDKKVPCAAPEKRTIIVRGQVAHESLNEDKKVDEDVKSPINLVKDDLPSNREIPGKETGAIPKHSAAVTKSAVKVEHLSTEMEIQKNLADTDNAVKEIRSALEADYLRESSRSRSRSPFSRSPDIKTKETKQMKGSTEETNYANASSAQTKKLSPTDNSTTNKIEVPTERIKSPSPRLEKDNLDNKKVGKPMTTDKQNVSPEQNVDQQPKNTTVVKKEKQINESNNNNTPTPELAEHPPVFSTVKNDKTSLIKESTELGETKPVTNQELGIKKQEIRKLKKNIDFLEESIATEHEPENRNDIPYIDSTTNTDKVMETPIEHSTSNDAINSKETKTVNKSKTVEATNLPNEQKPKQVNQVNSSNELEEASVDIKQLKNKDYTESNANNIKAKEIAGSSNTESSLKSSSKKHNQQDEKSSKPSTSGQKLISEDNNRAKSPEQNTQMNYQDANPIIKESVQNNVQKSTDENKTSSDKTSVTESKTDSHISPISSSNESRIKLNNSTTVGNQESLEKLITSKPLTFQTAEKDPKSKEKEMSVVSSLTITKSIDKGILSGELNKAETSKSPDLLQRNAEGISNNSIEAHPEKSNEEPTTSSGGTNIQVQSTSASNKSSSLSIESAEFPLEKLSPEEPSVLSDNSIFNDHSETLPSTSIEEVSLLKDHKKNAIEDEKLSPVERNLSPSVKSASPTTSETTTSKIETIVSEVRDESQNLLIMKDKTSNSTSPSSLKTVFDHTNESPTEAKEASLNTNEVQPKVIPESGPSSSKEGQEIPIKQTDSTKPEGQGLSLSSSSKSEVDSTTMSSQQVETTNNQHSKETLHENKTNDSESVTIVEERQSSNSRDSQFPSASNATKHEMLANNETSENNDEDEEDTESSDNSIQSSLEPPSPVEALRNRFEGLTNGNAGTIRPQSPMRRMSFRSTKAAIALERTRDTSVEKPWFAAKPATEQKKPPPKRSIKQQLEIDRKVRKMVADKKVRTYRKAEIVVQLMDLNFEEDEAIQAANECSTLEMAISFLQQDCLLCAGKYSVSQMISMVHCPHKACRECIRAYFTVQIRDRNIMELLCPFCNEPDIFDEDIAQDYFNHLDIMLKKLVDPEIHELFQRKLRDRVLMRDPNFRWCSKCSSGFIAMENLTRLVCPDCNAVMCASCRRPWEREHNGLSCEEFAALKDANDVESQAVGLAKLLTEDGIDCPMCHFRYQLAKGGCMHFRCTQCQHDFCSGCSRPFKMGQKCGVSEFCGKLGLHAHHPRNCLFYLRDKEPQDLQRLLDLSSVKYDRDPPEGVEVKRTCQVMEQKETADGMVDDCCGKEVEDGFAGLCRIHYVEYLGQLVNKNKVDPIQIFDVDDLELVLRRANIRLPYKKYRETDDKYRGRLVELIEEELPLDKMDGS